MDGNVNEKPSVGLSKRLAVTILSLIVVALVMTTFIVVWYSAGSFDGVFSGAELLQNLGIFAIILFIMFGIYAYIYFFDNKNLNNRSFLMIFVIMLITLIVCCISTDILNIFAMPVQLCAVLICVLLGQKIAAASNLMMSQLLLIVFLIKQPFATESMGIIAASIFCNAISGFVLLFLVSLNLSRFKFIAVGFMAGFIMAPFAAVVSVALGVDGIGILTNTLWVVIANIMSIVLYMPMLPIMESVFNVVTDFKLDELCNYSAPLLKKLSTEAPGTFNHSIIVANLSENCAMAIGENTHLARAAALYHDVGKLKNPEFFIENQHDGYNPHDDLIPEVSVSMITKHTKNGVKMIEEYHLPKELGTVALEHHGTCQIKAFYYKAQRITEGTLDDDMFRYDGPKPSTKIAAIVMLCDTAEAAIRALGLRDTGAIEEFVNGQIKEKLEDGQFDDCSVTMSDLAKIRATIVTVMAGIHHARIDYKK